MSGWRKVVPESGRRTARPSSWYAQAQARTTSHIRKLPLVMLLLGFNGSYTTQSYDNAELLALPTGTLYL